MVSLIVVIVLAVIIAGLVYAIVGLNELIDSLEETNDELQKQNKEFSEDKVYQMQKRFEAENKIRLIEEELSINPYSNFKNKVNRIKTILEEE